MTLTNEQYVKATGNICPFCSANNITAHQFTAGGDWAYQSVTCDECEREWTDTYKLTGYDYETIQ